MYCTKCGTQIETSKGFCSKCSTQQPTDGPAVLLMEGNREKSTIMKKMGKGLLIFAIIVVSVVAFVTFRMNYDEYTSGNSSLSKTNPVEQDVALAYDSDIEIGDALGAHGGKEDALLKKRLGTSVGKNIAIRHLFVASIGSSEWERGGNLDLINDYSMGQAFRIVCSVPPKIGDKFMETKAMRDIALTGTIASYSSSTGLHINPCNASW